MCICPYDILLLKSVKALAAKKITLVFLFFLLLDGLCVAGTNNTTINNNMWFMYFGNHPVSDKMRLHVEVQMRRHEIASNPQQLLLRGGINYYIKQHSFLTIGYCFVQTHPYGRNAVKSIFPENRIWQQIQSQQNIGRFETTGRLRIEQRFMNLPEIGVAGNYAPGKAVYFNRARLLYRVSVPLTGKTIQNHSPYFSMYNEVFVHFGKNAHVTSFEQNRFYIALGYQLPVAGRLEIGWMNQYLLKTDLIRVEKNYTAQVALISSLSLKKKRNEE